jgi:SNF2 family DNA or RNA helicase
MTLDTPGAFPYPFKTKPFKHQLTCWLRQKDEAAFAYFAEMGTGKSKMLIDTAAWLYDQDRIDSLIVIAPKGVYRNWADSELPTHMPEHIRYRVGIWTAEGKKTDEEKLAALTRKDRNVDLHILLMNVEALGRDLANNRAFKFLTDFLLGHQAMLAVDESTTIKNPTATRTKALMKARLLAPYRRVMSGQPAVNGPLDLYSQCAFLDPDLLGYGSYFSYRAHFANLVTLRIGQGKGERKVQVLNKTTPYRNLDELNRTLGKFSFIVKKEDCLDLPAKVYMPPRHVEMGKQQFQAYIRMQKLAMVELEEIFRKKEQQEAEPQREATWEEMQQGTLTVSEPPAPEQGVSSAGLVITQMLRLQQILCGFLVTDEKQVVPFDEPNPRMEALMEALDEAGGKSIIWATYKFNVRQIAARIAEQFGADSVVTYFGETSVEDRRTAIKRFQDPNDPCRFFVATGPGPVVSR